MHKTKNKIIIKIKNIKIIFNTIQIINSTINYINSIKYLKSAQNNKLTGIDKNNQTIFPTLNKLK